MGGERDEEPDRVSPGLPRTAGLVRFSRQGWLPGSALAESWILELESGVLNQTIRCDTWVLFYKIFIWKAELRQRERRKRGRGFPFTGSLPQVAQWPRAALQPGAPIFWVIQVSAGEQTLEPFPTTFPGMSERSGPGKGAVIIHTGYCYCPITQLGNQHCWQ